MVFSTINGFLCSNNADLVRDGYIWPFIIKEIPIEDFNLRLLDDPPRGSSYTILYEEDGTTPEKVRETRKLLPAEKITVEILFGKQMDNIITHPVDPGFVGSIGVLGAGAGWVMGAGLLGIGFGGPTSATSIITFHLCDAQTDINYPVTITEEHLQSGKIVLPTYPLSVFGIVKETLITDEQGAERRVGLVFTDEQLENIGKFSSGTTQMGVRRKIEGATDSLGQFGNIGSPEVSIEDVLLPEQENIFVEIERDERLFKFRGDNRDASGLRTFPPVSRSQNDITSNTIIINTEGLAVGDIIYITLSHVSQRRFRQNVRHVGTILQGNTVGGTALSNMMEMDSQVDVFDYQLKSWIVPKNIPENAQDRDYKVGPNEINNYYEDNLSDDNEVVEGWRTTEVLTDRLDYIWGADYRGIVLVVVQGGNQQAYVVWPRESIIEKESFDNYVNNASFSGKINEAFFRDQWTGALYDTSFSCNTLCFDREKFPYYREFALFLQNLENSRLGISHLDVFLKEYLSRRPITLDTLLRQPEPLVSNTAIDMSAFAQELYNFLGEDYDVANAEFSFSNIKPTRATDCDADTPPLFPSNYPCHIYNPGDYGGVFFATGQLDNDFLLWNPGGGAIESYWNLNTPWFCDNFETDSRIYIEGISGSLNNFSFVFCDTAARITSLISADRNFFADDTIIAFKDTQSADAISLMELHEGFYQSSKLAMRTDPTLNHDRDSFDRLRFNFVGSDRILGSHPCLSNGNPIINYDILGRSGRIFAILEDVTRHLDFIDTKNFTFPSDPFKKVFSIIITYEPTQKFDPYDTSIAVSFINEYNEENAVISDTYIPTGPIGRKKSVVIPCGLSHGSNIYVTGNVLGSINITSVRVVWVRDDNLGNFMVDSEQPCISIDSRGNYYLFAADETNFNISVLISNNRGITWFYYDSIIRLMKNETATFPQVFTREEDSFLHLFYILNNRYLMYKTLDPDLFNVDDATRKYQRPDSYDLDPDRAGALSVFTDDGINLRVETSYLVVGNLQDRFWQEEIEKNDRILRREDILHSVPRFSFFSDDFIRMSNLNVDFVADSYAFYNAQQGSSYIFYSSGGLLSIVKSENWRSWELLVDGIVIHKNILTDPNEISSLRNIQVVQKDFYTNIVYLIYYYSGMLFLHAIPSALLQQDDIGVQESLVSPNAIGKPVFLVGNIPSDIKEYIRDGRGNLGFRFPYSTREIDNFDINMGIDRDTQPYGMFLNEGEIRIFYRDIFEKINALTVSGLSSVDLDIQKSFI